MGTAVAALEGVRPGRAQAQMPLRICVLNDQSGIGADHSGMRTDTATTMAVVDSGGAVGGRPIELLHADRLSKPDVGVGIARQWYEQGVIAIFDTGLTTIALSVQSLAREKNRVLVP